jgi:ribosomal protein S18 acetylase RimI-like enzyme
MIKNSKDSVQYRLVKESDLPVIKEMYIRLNSYFYQLGYRLPHPENVGEEWLSSFKRTLGKFSNVFIAEMDQEVVGFMLCRIKSLPKYMGGVLVGELSDMWILEKARRKGIGDQLSHLAIDWLRQQDVHSVEIQVLRDNQASWKLYERMGFQLEYRAGRLLWEDYSGPEN